MTEQNDENPNIPPIDFAPGGFFLTDDGEGYKVTIAGLTQDQSARVFALQQARLSLTADAQTDRVELGNVHREWVRPASGPDAMDLYNIAQYIIDGSNPWDDTKAVEPIPLFATEPMVEIGGQRMTVRQYDAARAPLLDGSTTVGAEPDDEELPGFD